jgi:hypothetical protein
MPTEVLGDPQVAAGVPAGDVLAGRYRIQGGNRGRLCPPHPPGQNVCNPLLTDGAIKYMKHWLVAAPCLLTMSALVGCGSDNNTPASAAGGRAGANTGGTQATGGHANSGTGNGGAPQGGSSDGGCPDLAGTWTITAHCRAELIGQRATIRPSGCSFTMDSPIATQTVTGTVSADGAITLDVQDSSAPPVQCTGNVVSYTMTLVCVNGTCAQTLTRG